MKDFDWEKFKKGKIAVHCDAEEKAKDFLKECYDYGIKWFPPDENDTCWEEYKENTYYGCDCFGLYYGNIHRNALNTVEWGVQENVPQLKDGMVVEVRNGALYLIRTNCNDLILSNELGFLYGSSYNDNLEVYGDKQFDIMTVYNSQGCSLTNCFAPRHLKLLWKREEVEEMTLDEICKALGKKIKIKED